MHKIFRDYTPRDTTPLKAILVAQSNIEQLAHITGSQPPIFEDRGAFFMLHMKGVSRDRYLRVFTGDVLIWMDDGLFLPIKKEVFDALFIESDTDVIFTGGK